MLYFAFVTIDFFVFCDIIVSVNILFLVIDVKKKIFLITVAVLLTLACTFAYLQRNNIRGLIYSFKCSDGELEKMLAEADGEIKSSLEEIIGRSVREFTDEEIALIESGNATEQDIVEKIVKEELKKSESADKSSAEYCVAELYALKSRYIGLLDAMVDSAVNEYKALDESKRTRSKQLEIGASYAGKAMALEEECDAKVNSIAERLRKELDANGKDTAVVDRILSAYTNEKNIKRAYYLNMFK